MGAENGESDREFLEFARGRTEPLLRTAYLLSGDRHLAEDLVQETLGRLYVSWRRVRRAENPVAYAQTVLARTFFDHRRRRSSGERPTAELPDAAVTDGDPVVRLALLDGLAQLRPEDRAVLVLRYWEDLSVEATAAALRLSLGAVRNRSMRALTRLRAVLGEEFGDLVPR
ncbi:SigE family RNA polymerase sigma factor [Streptomyces sp. SBT349]|uniref:SigE family RNA polymerase sigma factor n=1 Tax=Streptomyces sp. SBT349 TaxID=1580539 RepID=UPI00066B1427|nr:SigE family RNA polymerase sigma factor [Streptomyces sp. SBT349]